MDLFILVPLFIIVFIFTTIMERKLSTITKQNDRIIALLEKISEGK